MRVLAIAGSLRRDSHNRALLRASARLVPEDVELVEFDGLKAIPAFDEDDEAGTAPASVTALREAIADADAVLVATPEYNSSIPGVLKNALDWASRPAATNVLRNKPVAVIGASTGMFGAVWAQAEARKVLAAIGARVLDRELPVARAHEQLHPEHGLADADLVAALEEMLEALAAEVRRDRQTQEPAPVR
jgi:chromate reductase, NAD(P)H dehydrogenase (quinone)